MELRAEEIASRLPRGLIGREIQVYPELSSTNDLAMSLGKNGSAEGLVIFAETQTAGRGRLGRRWQSQPGCGLWFSILLRPAWTDFSRLSLLAAVAVARGIGGFIREPAGIKWPNDLWLRGKKVAGILCEASSEAGGLVVVGIGLNVNHAPADFPPEIAGLATSLAIENGSPVDRASVAAAVLSAFEELYRRMPDAFPKIIAECERRSVLLGKKVRIEAGVEISEGIVTGLDPGGGLRVQTEEGLKIITAGEVTALRL